MGDECKGECLVFVGMRARARVCMGVRMCVRVHACVCLCSLQNFPLQKTNKNTQGAHAPTWQVARIHVGGPHQHSFHTPSFSPLPIPTNNHGYKYTHLYTYLPTRQIECGHTEERHQRWHPVVPQHVCAVLGSRVGL